MQTRCPQCYQEVSLSASICSTCQCAQGLDSLAGVDLTYRFKNQRLAFWFSLLLGGFGVHKFYLGQYYLGVIYLLFCWTFIPSIIGIVDAIRTHRMSPINFKNRYCRLSSYFSR